VTTTVLLVRHGSTDHLGHVISGRMEGVPLNDAGRREARRLAERLRGEDLAALYTSPVQRARETAAPVAEALGFGAVEDERLVEIDFGEWTGRRFGELGGDPRWRQWNEARASTRAPGGETMGEVQARLSAWLDDARARHPEARVAAVTHADVIKAVLADILGFSIDHHDRIEISPGSVTALAVGGWGRKVISVNEAPR
jgi:probable phosphomutase (TIGR03848 family)